MNEIFERLSETFGPARIADFLFLELLPDLLVAAATFAGIYLFWRALSRALRAVTSRSSLDETARSFVQAVLKYAVLTVAVIAALGQLGIDTGSLVASLGIAGLTIGFAARDALSNIISGIFIFWDRPFVIGDLVEIENSYGRVDTITMRSTRVVTPDGRMLAIPNATVLNTTVASYTNFPHLRLEIEATVGVDEDLGRVRRVLLETVSQDGRFMSDPAPAVAVTALGDYNVTVVLRAWLDNEKEHVSARMELREAVFEALRGAGVHLPYETIELRPLQVQQLDQEAA